MADEDLSANADDSDVQNTAADDNTDETTANDQGSDASDELAESLASELGWAPKDKWRGADEDWSDARTFLSNTVKINKDLRRDLKATREASERAARAAAQITERAVEQERQRLTREREDALTNFDTDAFNRADEQLQKLPQTAPIKSFEVEEFEQRNASWYNVDPDASAIAYNAAQRYANMGKGVAEQLAAAEAAVRKRFPEYFAEPKPKAKEPAAVELSNTRSSQPRKGPKGFNELPADAKAAALNFEKRGRATKEEYAQLYWQENA